MTILKIQNLTKRYSSPSGEDLLVLDVPAFQIEEAEPVALRGESGCGKTTLLHLIAGISTPTSGSIHLGEVELTRLSEAARDRARALNLGYVFQTFQLLPAYSALENVLLGMMFGPGPDRDFARSLLERLGLSSRLDHRPHQLSIGQQQRVALARALANRPRLVLADEPTGNLDPAHKEEAVQLIQEICREHQAALLLVSHDPTVLAAFERVVPMAEINRALAPAGPATPPGKGS